MSWESIEEWPEGVRGDAFRTAAEPILAQRRSRSWGERIRAFLASTDEERLEHIIDKIAITEARVYVERASGERFRAPRASLIGLQREGRKVRYGVYHGDDFVLYTRVGCDVEEMLADQLGEPSERLLLKSQMLPLGVILFGGFVVTGFAGASIWNLRNYSLGSLFADGLYTSEGALAFYLTLGLLAAALLFWLLMPARTHADRLGLHRTRGVFRLLRWHVPVEEVERIMVREVAGVAIDIVAELNTKRRFGGAMDSQSCVLETIQVAKGKLRQSRALARHRRRAVEVCLAGRALTDESASEQDEK